MGQQERIQVLRQLLSRPRQKSWAALWTEVEAWPTDEALDLERDYLALHLHSWPDHTKVLKEKVYKSWLAGEDHPLFPFVRGLSFPEHNTTEDAPRIQESPYAHHIKHLSFSGWVRTPGEVQGFFDKCTLPLTSLAWRNSQINAKALSALLKQPSLQGLTRLALPCNAIQDQDCHTLLESASPGLKELDLTQNLLTKEGAKTLLQSPQLVQLTRLSLNWNPLHNTENTRNTENTENTDSAEHSTRSLQSLQLAYNHLSPQGFLELLETSTPETLTWLDLSGNALGPQQLLAIVRRLPVLKSLNLRCTDLGDKGALALADALPGSVEALDLSYAGLSPRTLRALEAHPNLRHATITCAPIQTQSLDASEARASFVVHQAAVSDVGPVRAHNEDEEAAYPTLGIYTIADGMGGQSSGAIASNLVTRALLRRLGPTLGTPGEGRITPGTFSTFDYCSEIQESAALPVSLEAPNQAEGLMLRQVHRANELLVASSDAKHTNTSNRGQGSCFAGVAIHGSRATLANVGFARIYRLRHGCMEQLTEDHSLVGEYIKMGKLTPAEAKVHRFKNIVTRSVGMKLDLNIATSSIQLAHDDLYLLCTDGLHQFVSDERIQEALEEHLGAFVGAARAQALQPACEHLVALADAENANDNITAMLLLVQQKEEA